MRQFIHVDSLSDFLADAKKEQSGSAGLKAERLPERKNFIEWYNSLLSLAEIADRSYPVKGTFVWMPYGLRIMKRIVSILDKKFKEAGIEEVLFPLFVNLDFARQNDKWFETFKKEAFYVEGKELLLRPTGEPAMYPIFKAWMARGKLPIRVYETVSSYRNESKTTHTMIRDREISFWHEIHTVHKTRAESIAEADMHRTMYEYMWKDILNIPPIVVSKPDYEIFAGADSAFEFYTILPDGRLLENGSVNNLGQSYAKKFDLYYTNDKGEKEYVWQVCTGNGARFLAAVMAVHGDDKGLVLPPEIAPIGVVIVPIFKSGKEETVKKEATALEALLVKAGIETYLDNSDVTPGEKFNVWELKGAPIRIELGEREVEEKTYTVFRRDSNKRYKVKKEEIVTEVGALLKKGIPEGLFSNAKNVYNGKIVRAGSLNDAKALIEGGKVVKANWCEKEACFNAISGIAPSVEAIGTLVGEEQQGACISCGQQTNKLTLIGRTY